MAETPQLKNIRLLIEYEGTDFCGWQRQLGKETIQQLLEDIIFKVVGRKVIVYGASRTDSGVHARGQVANFYTDAPLPVAKWAFVLNFWLPRTVRIVEAVEVPMWFHAQKCAVGKIYNYRILNRPLNSALDRRVYFVPAPLDWTKIAQALPYFVGEKDFRSFQAAKAEVLTTVRRIEEFHLLDEGSGFYTLRIRGTGFLKQMVRTIVGTLVEVGLSKRTPESMAAVIASVDRMKAGPTAPASGLTLVRVFYPEW